MKTFNLGIYDIVVTISDGAGIINSSLIDDCETNDNGYYEIAISTLESIILAHACAGINIESPEYISGLQVSIDAICNNYL